MGHLSESVLRVVCYVVSVGLGLRLQVLKSNASGGLKVCMPSGMAKDWCARRVVLMNMKGKESSNGGK